jgi:hypothetical protein
MQVTALVSGYLQITPDEVDPAPAYTPSPSSIFSVNYDGMETCRGEREPSFLSLGKTTAADITVPISVGPPSSQNAIWTVGWPSLLCVASPWPACPSAAKTAPDTSRRAGGWLDLDCEGDPRVLRWSSSREMGPTVS